MSEETKPEAKLVNPPKQTEMVAKKSKVKVKTLRPIRIAGEKEGDTVEVRAGEVVEVSPSEAAEFCDKEFDGHYDYFGERFNKRDVIQKHKIVRAVRVA